MTRQTLHIRSRAFEDRIGFTNLLLVRRKRNLERVNLAGQLWVLTLIDHSRRHNSVNPSFGGSSYHNTSRLRQIELTERPVKVVRIWDPDQCIWHRIL